MLLVAVATDQEISPLQQRYATQQRIKILITGIGPVLAAVNLGHYLAGQGAGVDAVLNVGVAGAYVGSDAGLLDICLARHEVVGDFGICMQDEILDFDAGNVQQKSSISLDKMFSGQISGILQQNSIPHKVVNFVTVNSCSGTRKRGEYLQKKFAACCENMEGAGVAFVCKKFSIPCAELRCVSNMVDDRNRDSWLLNEATEKICWAIDIILRDYLKGWPQEK